MTQTGTTDPQQAPHVLVLTRAFDAPRERVFRAFADPERFAQWWGNTGSATRVVEFDLRPGGRCLYTQRGPEGQDAWGKFEYREVEPPERLVFTSSFSDAAGRTVRAPFSATWPLAILNVLTLAEHQGRTLLTLRGEPYEATDEERAAFGAARPFIEQGFTGTFDRLADHLARHTHAQT